MRSSTGETSLVPYQSGLWPVYLRFQQTPRHPKLRAAMDEAMALPRQQRLRALMDSDTFKAWCRYDHLEEYEIRYFSEVISREIEWRVEEFLPRRDSIKLTDLKSEDVRELDEVHRCIETMREEWYYAREMVWKSRNSREKESSSPASLK